MKSSADQIDELLAALRPRLASACYGASTGVSAVRRMTHLLEALTYAECVARLNAIVGTEARS